MRLIHRTNYWGDTISWSNRDAEVDMDAIWVQVARRRKDRSCCPGFGKRLVRVTIDKLTSSHNGWWDLFSVSGTEGRNSDHYFKKLVLIPQGTKTFDEERCIKVHGWELEGRWDASIQSAEEDLQDLLEEHLTQDGYTKTHAHVGIYMESCFAGKGNSY
mmetsp:Transcript_29522/g.48716  ORF Transcript_29522/g.48716 Transcript_29522/m.48716 type:complete len:159 (+) Transcript_29522:96-572(+)